MMRELKIWETHVVQLDPLPDVGRNEPNKILMIHSSRIIHSLVQLNQNAIWNGLGNKTRHPLLLVLRRGPTKKKQGGSTTNLDPETDLTIGTNNITLTVAQFRKQWSMVSCLGQLAQTAEAIYPQITKESQILTSLKEISQRRSCSTIPDERPMMTEKKPCLRKGLHWQWRRLCEALRNKSVEQISLKINFVRMLTILALTLPIWISRLIILTLVSLHQPKTFPWKFSEIKMGTPPCLPREGNQKLVQSQGSVRKICIEFYLFNMELLEICSLSKRLASSTESQSYNQKFCLQKSHI